MTSDLIIGHRANGERRLELIAEAPPEAEGKT